MGGPLWLHRTLLPLSPTWTAHSRLANPWIAGKPKNWGCESKNDGNVVVCDVYIYIYIHIIYIYIHIIHIYIYTYIVNWLAASKSNKEAESLKSSHHQWISDLAAFIATRCKLPSDRPLSHQNGCPQPRLPLLMASRLPPSTHPRAPWAMCLRYALWYWRGSWLSLGKTGWSCMQAEMSWFHIPKKINI